MDPIAQVLAAIRMAQSRPMTDEIRKAWTQAGGGAPGSTGLVYYDLQAPALRLYPVLTPLRNRIPRVAADGGTATNWKAILDVNTDRLQMGVGEGRRGGVIKNLVKDYMAAYKGMGLEENLTFESEYAAVNFDDIRARAVQSLLNSFMIAEEQVILGGNNSHALGTPAAPIVAHTDTGGTVPIGTISVRVVALTHEGFYHGSVSGGIKGEVVRTDADGLTTTYGGGSSQGSAAAATTTTVATSAVQAHCVPIPGAFAYAWFAGTDATSNCKLVAITTVTDVVITALNAAGMAINDGPAKLLTQDNSRNQTTYDGLLSYASDPTNGSYQLALGTGGAGAPLSDGDGAGIAEIDTALQHFWDAYRLSPDAIYVSAQEKTSITKAVIKSGGAPLIRINRDVDQAGLSLSAGLTVGEYLNRYTMAGSQMIPIVLHPNMPAGTIYFHSWSIPYPLSNVGNVVQLKMRRDYYQIEWPLKTRMYEFGIYADGVLQHYFPPSCGVITNIKPTP